MLNNSLSVVFGEYGSGKSYLAVRSAYKAYLEGAVIISNMWLAFPHIRFYTNDQLIPILKELDIYHREKITPYYAPDSFLIAHDIESSDEEPKTFYILIDEGNVFFDSREFASNFKDPALRNMLHTPRHYNLQITIISQKIALLDRKIRDMAHEIIEFMPALFGIFRKGISYDVNRFFLGDDGGLNMECPTVESEWFFFYFQRKKDTSDFFGGLYFTMEVLGDLAIRHSSHVLSIKEYLEKEKELEGIDWRQGYISRGMNFVKQEIEHTTDKIKELPRNPFQKN